MLAGLNRGLEEICESDSDRGEKVHTRGPTFGLNEELSGLSTM